MKMLRFTTALLGLIFLLSACDDFEIRPVEPEAPATFEPPADGQDLRSFLQGNNLTEQRDSLIACAFSGDHAFLPAGLGADARILAYSYFPEGEFFYFHSTDRTAPSDNLSHYVFRRPLGARSVADGFFEVLPMVQPAAGAFERVMVVRVIGGTAYLSNTIFLKGTDVRTASFSGQLDMTAAAGGNPSFAWPGEPGDNVIYFQLLTDGNDRVVSGTYTTEPRFTFYETINVVLNVSPGTPPTSLPASGGPYRMTVMGVGENNWVNFMRDVGF